MFLYIYVSLFFFSFPSLSLLSPRLSRFSFTRLFAPSRASASRPPSVHCSNWNGIINRGPVTSRHLSSSRAINTIGRMVAMVVVHRSARLTRFVILPSPAALSLPNRHARGFVPFRFVPFRSVSFRSVRARGNLEIYVRKFRNEEIVPDGTIEGIVHAKLEMKLFVSRATSPFQTAWKQP